jgi:hypothetical protein
MQFHSNLRITCWILVEFMVLFRNPHIEHDRDGLLDGGQSQYAIYGLTLGALFPIKVQHSHVITGTVQLVVPE